jgi:hypothetical protein
MRRPICKSGSAGFIAGDIRLKTGIKTPIGSNGCYEAEVEIFNGVDWKPKIGNDGVASFFPDNMTQAEILEEIAFARSKVQPSNWYLDPTKTQSNSYRLNLTFGDKLEMYIGSQVSTTPSVVQGNLISGVN